VPVEVGQRRAGDPAQLVASSDEIRGDLGWTPKHTDLAGIVRDAWETAQK
jgi:UDP-glucose 4-epimerase